MKPVAGETARYSQAVHTPRSNPLVRAARAVALCGALASIQCSSGDGDEGDLLPGGAAGSTSGGGGTAGSGLSAGASQAGNPAGSGATGTSSGGSSASSAGAGGSGGAATPLGGSGASGGNAGAGSGGMSAGAGAASAAGAGRGGQGGDGSAGRGGGGASGNTSGGRGGRGSGGSAAGGSGGTAGGGASGGSGSGQTGEFAGTLEAHNAVRAAVETTNPLMPLTWSDDLAAVAQDWADTLAEECDGIRHRMPNQYGENIAAQWSSNGTAGAYGPQAVDAWAAEIECWSFGTIAGTETCNSQCIAMQNSNGCGHYTQLVWRNTKRVGCGYATCRDGNLLMEIFVCNYDPPGNYRGQAPY